MGTRAIPVSSCELARAAPINIGKQGAKAADRCQPLPSFSRNPSNRDRSDPPQETDTSVGAFCDLLILKKNGSLQRSADHGE